MPSTSDFVLCNHISYLEKASFSVTPNNKDNLFNHILCQMMKLFLVRKIQSFTQQAEFSSISQACISYISYELYTN